jgi:hypothetical protein
MSSFKPLISASTGSGGKVARRRQARGVRELWRFASGRRGSTPIRSVLRGRLQRVSVASVPEGLFDCQLCHYFRALFHPLMLL